jgi:hypothetical protein
MSGVMGERGMDIHLHSLLTYVAAVLLTFASVYCDSDIASGSIIT